MTRGPKRKFTPFLVLTLLLYGSFAWLSREPGGRFVVKTGGLRRHLRTSYSRLGEYFEWLERNGYVTEVKRTHGQVSGALRPPVS